MALRFQVANIATQGFTGGELKLKSRRIGLRSGVLTICPNFRSANSVRRLLCDGSNLNADNSGSFTPKSYCDVLMERRYRENGKNTLWNTSAGSSLNADTSGTFTPKSYYDVLMESDEDTLSNIRVGGGHWVCAVEMPEVIEAADLAVKLYNNQQNAKLELVGLVKAYGTVCAGWWFEIILEAVDHDTGEKNEYEACVWLHAVKKSCSELSYLRLASDKS